MPVDTRSFEWLTAFVLTLARVGGVFSFVPFPAFKQAPDLVKVALSVLVTIALYPVWPKWVGPMPSEGFLVVVLMSEAALGITIGLSVRFIEEALLLSSQMVGLQAGYSFASTIDPSSQADSSVLQVLASLMASLLFFAFRLHEHVIRALAQSMVSHPPGHIMQLSASAEPLIRLGSTIFTAGLRLAFPIVALLMFIDISLALLGRLNQQLQLLSLSFPVKMLVALVVLGLTGPAIPLIYESTAIQNLGFAVRSLR
jgi:flagellar biosynthesis protein FliR